MCIIQNFRSGDMLDLSTEVVKLLVNTNISMIVEFFRAVIFQNQVTCNMHHQIMWNHLTEVCTTGDELEQVEMQLKKLNHSAIASRWSLRKSEVLTARQKELAGTMGSWSLKDNNDGFDDIQIMLMSVHASVLVSRFDTAQ